jgi:hypothetical protein
MRTTEMETEPSLRLNVLTPAELSERQRRWRTLLLGFGLGAAAAYYLDIRSGPYRRSIARDQLAHLANRSALEGGRQARNLRNRLFGFLARGARRIQGEPAVSDRKLAERIRSRLGRVLLHPSAIEVDVTHGHVRTRGKLEHEAALRSLAAIRGVRGVLTVEDQIERTSLPS